MRPEKKTTVSGPLELIDLVGQELGTSGVLAISQDQINGFADVTGDHQWIHVDVEKAAQGPFGTTIAHGFLTLSLVPEMLSEILEVEEFSMGINYGLDRVRFIKPVPAGVAIQGTATLVGATPIAGADDTPNAGVQGKVSMSVEFADEGQACCVAEVLFRYYV